MKFAHISDVRLGMRVEAGTPSEKAASQSLYDAFVTFVDNMQLEPVDFIFITGDLFDHVPDKSEIVFVDNLLAQLPNTVIIYVTGEHDYLKNGAAIWDFTFRSNLYLLNGEPFRNHVRPELAGERTPYAEGVVDCIHFPKFKLDIYGFCQYTPENPRNDVDTIYIHDQKRVNILLGHGGDETCEPFEPEDLNAKGFDYVGFGHRDNYFEHKKANLYYPGALEPLGPWCPGKHGYIKGYADGLVTSAKLVPQAMRHYEEVEKELHFDVEKIAKINEDNNLGATIRRIRTADSLYTNAALDFYVDRMFESLSKLSGVPRNLIEEEHLSSDLVNHADEDMKEALKKELLALREGVDLYYEERGKLSEKLEEHPDYTGEINVLSEKIRDKKYGTGTLEFAEAQVNRIDDRKRTHFVMLMMSPVVIILALAIVIGAVYAFVLMAWDEWLDTVLFLGAYAILVGLFGFVLFNRTRKLRAKLKGTKNISEIHAENQTRLSIAYGELAELDNQMTLLQDKQRMHDRAAEELRVLEEKYSKLEKRFSMISLIFG